MVHRGPGFLAVVWYGSFTTTPPSASCLSFSVLLYAASRAYRWEVEGVGEEPIIRQRESLVLYKSLYSLVGPNQTIKRDKGCDDKLKFLFCHLQWILWTCLASQPLGRHAARQVVELVQNRFCEEHVEAALSLHQRVPSQLVDEILPSKRTCLSMSPLAS